MANERGRLPKVRREELNEHLRRMLDRWYSNAYEDDNLFLTMACRPGLLDATWGFIRYIYGGGSSIEPELFDDAQALANGFFHDLPHPVLGSVRVLAPPVRMDGDGFQPGAPTPAFASQTRAILGELGFDAAAIERLLKEKVTRAAD